MGFRYRRSIRLAPGLKINLSKSGPSLSVGRRGATMNFGPRGTKLTVGIPGTGMSYQTKLAPSGRKRTIATTRQAKAEQADASYLATSSHASIGPRRLGLALMAGTIAAFGLLIAGGVGLSAPSGPTVASVADAIARPASASEEQVPTRETVEIAAPANIREAPQLDSRVVGVAAKNARYGVFSRSGAWTLIGVDTAVGWVGNSRLTPVAK